jgi:hypothetical protein
MSLLDALDGIKTSEAQIVAISKTLYHLLPELIVPFDGQVTCGFFDWPSLPKRPHRDWLSEVYSLLGELAGGVGARELDRLGRPTWPLDSAVGLACGLARRGLWTSGWRGTGGRETRIGTCLEELVEAVLSYRW